MERLQIDVPTGLRAQLKAEAKVKGMFLQSYINQILDERAKSKDVISIKGTALVVGAEDKRDPEVQKVIDHFEASIGKLPRLPFQRRATKTLIQRHGFERTIGGINAIKAIRGERYAPRISSLEQLRDKWIELETFAHHHTKPKGIKIS